MSYVYTYHVIFYLYSPESLFIDYCFNGAE